MTIAPFSLIERDPYGRIKRLTPLRYVSPAMLHRWNDKVADRRARDRLKGPRA